MINNSFQLQEVCRSLNDAEQKFAPAKIFMQGDKTLLNEGVRVAIIGSRKASRIWPEGRTSAAKDWQLL